MFFGREHFVLSLLCVQVAQISMSGEESSYTVESEQSARYALYNLLQVFRVSGSTWAVGEQGISGEQVRAEGEGRGSGRVSRGVNRGQRYAAGADFVAVGD